jgi:hypothetical protein
MPADDSLGLDEDERVSPIPPCRLEKDPEDAVVPPQLWTSDGALQGRELLPQRHVLEGDGSVP